MIRGLICTCVGYEKITLNDGLDGIYFSEMFSYATDLPFCVSVVLHIFVQLVKMTRDIPWYLPA